MGVLLITLGAIWTACTLLHCVESQSLFSQNNMKFAIKLYQTLVEVEGDKNLVVSPFSIQTAGAIMYSGARGKTAEDMAQAFQLPAHNRWDLATDFHKVLESHKKERLHIENKIYVATGLKIDPIFDQILDEIYYSSEESINFHNPRESADAINKWVSNVTHGKIETIIDRNTLNQDTSAMMLNAIYLKGYWKIPFVLSFKKRFFNPTTGYKKITFMINQSMYLYGFSTKLDAKILEMEYINSQLSMLIILPERKDGLNELEKKLDNVDFLDISKDLKRDVVEVSIPKFRIEYSTDLKNALTKMGLGAIFSDIADFGYMIEEKPLQISNVLHKTFIDVNELGTEPAAVKSGDWMSMLKTKRFYAGHPFVFVIKSKTAVLFLGRFIGMILYACNAIWLIQLINHLHFACNFEHL